MPDALRHAITIARDAAAGWGRHGTSHMAAALSFYTLFSLAPMLMVVMAVFGRFLGKDEVQGQLQGWLVDTMGPDTAATVMELVQNADKPGAQVVTALIGVVTIGLAATRTFGYFQEALDRIWESPPVAASGLWRAITSKATAFSLVLSIGVFVFVSVTVGALLQGFADYLALHYGFPSQLAVRAHQAADLLVMSGAFAAIYRFVPARTEGAKNVLLGGFITALLFEVGKHGIGLYLGRSSPGSAYGASGSLVVLLLWMYYSAMIVLGGAEITQAIARLRRAATEE